MNDYLTKYQYKNTKTGQDPLSPPPLSSLSPLLSIFIHCLPLSPSLLLFPAVDLWSCLADASGKPVMEVMKTWTQQMGYPVLTVDAKQVRVHAHF